MIRYATNWIINNAPAVITICIIINKHNAVYNTWTFRIFSNVAMYILHQVYFGQRAWFLEFQEVSICVYICPQAIENHSREMKQITSHPAFQFPYMALLLILLMDVTLVMLS